MVKKLEGAGLRGQVAGETSLCTVGQEEGLAYRGHKIETLAEKGTFEEVAYLLLYGKLPNTSELSDYKSLLKSLRDLPDSLKKVLREIPASAHPMAVMATGCSMLGNLELKSQWMHKWILSIEWLQPCPQLLPIGINFLMMVKILVLLMMKKQWQVISYISFHGKTPSDLHRRVMDASLVLYAEHEFNASTFTARVCASTMSDIFSCVVAAIGSLKGPLHGGANEAAMEMIENWKTREEAKTNILDMLANKGKIMGFGHAIYSERDPRNAVIKEFSKELSQEYGDDSLYQVSEEVEQVMWDEKRLFPNADFFHASAYFYLGIPTKLFTPIFVMSRVTGWTAHCMEQRANNRIIRPSAEYTGPETAVWVDLEDRE